MALKVVTLTQPNPSGPFNEGLTDTVVVSGGAADAAEVILSNAEGKVDLSLLPAGANLIGTHAEPLTDGLGNLVIANGDVIMVLGVLD